MRSPLAKAVCAGVMMVLEHSTPEPEGKCRLLQFAVDIVGRGAQESIFPKLGDYMEVRDLVSDIWESNQKLVQQFLGQFTNRESKTLYFH